MGTRYQSPPTTHEENPTRHCPYLDGVAARFEGHPVIVEESDLFFGFSVSVGEQVLLQRRQLRGDKVKSEWNSSAGNRADKTTQIHCPPPPPPPPQYFSHSLPL